MDCTWSERRFGEHQALGAILAGPRRTRESEMNMCCDSLADALPSLASGRSNAVVNSEGALRHLVAARFAEVIRVPRFLLAPAFMAIALPDNSSLKKPVDRALIKITAGSEWKSVEEGYFGR